MSVRRSFIALVSSLLLILSCSGITAFAEVALPDGAVKGLPERLTAMDNEGNVVSSSTGEYFFHVEDMDYGVTYTKEVQLMNLRDDKSYHIYFYVEPLWKDGQIDLEKGCHCTFWLDGDVVFEGKVTGEPDAGYLDLTENIIDCGNYAPGDSHTLKCAVVWNDLDVLVGVDNGHRLIDVDGEHVLVGPDENGYVEGQIEFKWIFYAAVDEDYEPPNTGLMGVNDSFWLVCMGVLLVLILAMLVLVMSKKKRKKAKNSAPISADGEEP